MHTGQLIKKIRLIKGLSQKGIAMQLGISQQAYSKIEKQEIIPEKKIEELIRLIGCSIDDIVSIANTPLFTEGNC